MLILNVMKKELGVAIKNNNTSYTEKYEAHIPCSFACKVLCADDKFGKPVVLYRGKIRFMNLLKQFLGSTIMAKK